MNRIGWAGAMPAAVLFVWSAIPARAQEYEAKLSGFQETGGLPGPTTAETGAILSTGEGSLELTVDKAAQTIAYTLTYTFPTMTTTSAGSVLTDVLQSHIHFGKEHVPGGIMVYFCSTAALAPGGLAATPPLCPVSAGKAVSVSGTLRPDDVTAKAAAQGVVALDFDGVVAALASDTAYVNIHTMAYPAGEIRGQIHLVRHFRGPRGKGDDHAKDNNSNH